jgi:hypothetical protein
MRSKLGTWFEIIRHGSATAPRRLPRSDRMTDTQLRYRLPVPNDWARTHDSLREISREDMLAALPSAGPQRVLMLSGLRSIFKVLKGHKLVFVNPTGWIRRQLPIAEQYIRQDRIRTEADATGGDIRALCDLFSISIAGAHRYSANAAAGTSCGPKPGPVGR